MNHLPFQVIHLKGSPVQRGIIYGERCKQLIHANLHIYKQWCKKAAGKKWDDAKSYALRIMKYIEEADSEIAEEIEGTAQGAEVDLLDLVLLNARTELVYSFPMPTECTSIAIDRRRSGGSVLIAENWDWLPSVEDTTVLLVIEQPGKPTVFTFTEAGMVGKIGINSSRVALCVNLLSAGFGLEGLPFHVLCRMALNKPTLSKAIASLSTATRAGSGNFLLASPDCEPINIETTPYEINELFPENGLIAHTNHFINKLSKGQDIYKLQYPDSLTRLSRVKTILGADPVALDKLKIVFSDHASYPDSICNHADQSKVEVLRSQTNASIIFDLTCDSVSLLKGRPCQNSYYGLSLEQYLGPYSPIVIDK